VIVELRDAVMASLIEAFLHTYARRGSAPALLCEGVEYSFRDVAARAAAVAAGLMRRGVRPGDRIAVGLPNSPDLVAAVLGVIEAGAVLVPVNPAAAADELVYIVNDAAVRIAIVTPEHSTVLMQAQTRELSTILTTVDAVSTAPPTMPTVEAEAAALIVYTSGTTGHPKGAVLSHGALLGNLTTVAQAWRWTEEDRLLLTLPCFHLHGLGLGIITSFLLGSSIALRRRFVADEVCADLEHSQATMFFGVPTMYNRLVTLPDEVLAAHDLRRMRLWVSGSAPLPVSTCERFQQRFGRTLHDRYGMTECGFVLATPYDAPRRPGTVGVPLPGITVRIIDPEGADAGKLIDVPGGATGEIVIRGPNLFSGYWNRPEETRRVLLDGYLRSGDLAVREPDGLVRIVGRSSVDIIKSRGYKISAIEIENCVQRHPSVEEVAVIGMPDADQGERIVAAVTPAQGSGVTADAVRAFARDHLAPHKVPAEIVFMDVIPRTGPGKFKKKELIQQLSRRSKGA
jgi:acyl-CoA synthetase (AMP-forming)/AMP-acid ligase II